MEEKLHSSQSTEQAERIAQDGTDVRKRIRELILQGLKAGKRGLEGFTDLAAEVLNGVVRGMEEAVPKDQKSTLRQALDGIMDAGSAAAHATRLAFEDARQRGEAFAAEDLKKALQDLKGAEQNALAAFENLAKRSNEETAAQLRAFVEQAKQTGSSMKPAVDAALSSVRNHPLEFAGETIVAGATFTRCAAGHLLHAVSSVLEKTGDSLLRREIVESGATIQPGVKPEEDNPLSGGGSDNC